MRPAGAIWSNVQDMSRYVMTELSGGVAPRRARVVTAENIAKRREPQARMSDKLSYGVGLMLQDDHGVKVIQHGGNNLGYTADMYFLPDHGGGGRGPPDERTGTNFHGRRPAALDGDSLRRQGGGVPDPCLRREAAGEAGNQKLLEDVRFEPGR